MLEQYGTDNWHGEVDRVHAGILELAAGNLDSIMELVDVARQDYRNILYWLTFDDDGNPPPIGFG